VGEFLGTAHVSVVDLIEWRIDLSAEMNDANFGLNPSQVDNIAVVVRKSTKNRGTDVIFEVSASDCALNEAICTVCYNGIVIVLS
jgi:threonine dehydrogenase-like Zn-dependent dehydrogenase